MSRHPIFDQAAYGPDTSFKASLEVTAEIEHLPDDGTGLLCRLVEGDGPVGADVLVTGAVGHWSNCVLSCARPGDMVALAGKADPIDAGASQTRPLLQVNNPARLEVWRRAAAGPHPIEHGGATA